MQVGVEISKVGHQIRVNYFCFELRAHWKRLWMSCEAWSLKKRHENWNELAFVWRVPLKDCDLKLEFQSAHKEISLNHTKTFQKLPGLVACLFAEFHDRRFRTARWFAIAQRPACALRIAAFFFDSWGLDNKSTNVESKSVFTPSDGMPFDGIRLGPSRLTLHLSWWCFDIFPGRSTSNGT